MTTVRRLPFVGVRQVSTAGISFTRSTKSRGTTVLGGDTKTPTAPVEQAPIPFWAKSVVAGSLLASGGLVHAAPDVLPGVKQYEVLVPSFIVDPNGSLGSEVIDSAKNMLGDISDRGMAAGRIELNTAGLRAFVWSFNPHFGVEPFTTSWLPLPADGAGQLFSTCEAFDVSEYGVVAGGAGDIASLSSSGTDSSDWSARGVLWRLPTSASESITWQRIDPPNDELHGMWPQSQYGVTILEAISAELPLRAVGFAGSVFSCSGSFGSGRPAVFAVSFAANSSLPEYWTDIEARPDGNGAVKSRLLGISRDGEFLVGAQNRSLGCEVDPAPNGIPCAPTRWDRSYVGDPTSLTPTTLECAVPGTERITSEIRAVSRLSETSTEGLGVGHVMRFDEGPLGRFPHAWKFPLVATDPEGPQAEPLLLPPPPNSGGVYGLVDDIERARWLNGASRVPFHLAVGESKAADAVALETSGTLWFWSGESWHNNAWTSIDVNSPGVLTDGWKQSESDRVIRIRGVNQWGDCTGTAVIAGVRRPVVLRAVRLIGDLDVNDCVEASDLALLLGAWCIEENCDASKFAFDLNRDGSVGAADLSLLLANWGSGSGCQAGAIESPVPILVAAASKSNVDFAADFLGLQDIDGYRRWSATAPPIAVAIVDEVLWIIAKSRQSE